MGVNPVLKASVTIIKPGCRLSHNSGGFMKVDVRLALDRAFVAGHIGCFCMEPPPKPILKLQTMYWFEFQDHVPHKESTP